MLYSIKRYSKIILVLIAVLSHVLVISALEPEDLLAPTIGPVVVLPSAALSIGYVDNVFLFSDDSNKIDDYITTLSPKISFQYGENFLDSNYVGLNYSPNFQWYSENNELNSDNHALGFAINYNKEGKFLFTGSDQISFDNTLLTGGERSFYYSNTNGAQDDELGLLVERLSTNDQYRFEYTLSPKTSFYLATAYDLVDYASEPHYYSKTVFGDLIPTSLYDVSNWENTVGFGWQALTKIKFYGSLFYGNTHVDKNLDSMGSPPDSNFQGGHLSAVANFSDKFNFKLQVGYQTRDFDARGDTQKSQNLVIFDTEIEYKYSNKGDVSFAYSRGGEVSIFDPNTAVKSDILTLSINQNLGTRDKLSLVSNSIFSLNSFENREALKNRFFRVDAGLAYRFNEWMSTGLSYGIDFFDSSYQGNVDYNVNKVMFVFSVGY
tara:strand:- start:5691 stop:6995 length:1305 start_codon:yes stop_codon:yes gene_type:complete